MHINVMNECAQFGVICAEADSSRRQKPSRQRHCELKLQEEHEIMIFITYEGRYHLALMEVESATLKY